MPKLSEISQIKSRQRVQHRSCGRNDRCTVTYNRLSVPIRPSKSAPIRPVTATSRSARRSLSYSFSFLLHSALSAIDVRRPTSGARLRFATITKGDGRSSLGFSACIGCLREADPRRLRSLDRIRSCDHDRDQYNFVGRDSRAQRLLFDDHGGRNRRTGTMRTGGENAM